MKLNVSFVNDPETGREHAVVSDDRGHTMPCIRYVSVDYGYDQPAEVTITLLVNRRDVTLGATPNGKTPRHHMVSDDD